MTKLEITRKLQGYVGIRLKVQAPLASTALALRHRNVPPRLEHHHCDRSTGESVSNNELRNYTTNSERTGQ